MIENTLMLACQLADLNQKIVVIKEGKILPAIYTPMAKLEEVLIDTIKTLDIRNIVYTGPDIIVKDLLKPMVEKFEFDIKIDNLT